VVRFRGVSDWETKGGIIGSSRDCRVGACAG